MIVTRAGRHHVASCAALILCFAGESAVVADSGLRGVVVSDLAPNAAAATAGIEAGDLLTGWAAAGDDRRINAIGTPFDILELEREIHPLGAVAIHGVRDSNPFTVTLGAGRWRMSTQPNWNDAAQSAVAELNELLAGDDTEAALAAADRLFTSLDRQGERLHGVWVLADTASRVGRSGDWAEASHLYERAVALLQDAGHDEAQAYLAYQRGVALMREGDFEASSAAFTEALRLHRAINPERLGVAASLIGIGRVAERRSLFDEAKARLEEGLRLQEKLAPDSLLVASTLNELGRSAASRARMAEAEAYFQRALDIAEAILPGGSEVAGYLNSLAVASYLQGDIAGAEKMWLRSLAIKEAHEPDSSNVAAVLHNVGLVKIKRGDYVEAEKLYRRALEIHQRTSPNSLAATRTLNNLGLLAMEQGDLAAAEKFHMQAHAMRVEMVPDSLDLAASLVNLGNVAKHRDELERAQSHYVEALAIQSKHAPEARRQGTIFLNLGSIESRRGEVGNAREYFERGLAVFQNIAPGGPGEGEAFLLLGDLAFERQKLDDALSAFTSALAIFENVAPQSYPEAEALYGLARVHRQHGRTEDALLYFERAVDALDTQHTRLGGSEETKATIRAKYIAVYKDYIDFLIELGEHDRAFEILERSRSKILSDLLAERDLVFSADLPDDLERRRRMLAYNYESLQAKLYEATDKDAIDDLHASLAEIRQQQQQLRSDIREHAPRLADLKYPSPVNVEQSRGLIPPGTQVVSYSVGPDATHAFLLRHDSGLVVRTLDIGRSRLDNLVTRYRLLMDAGRRNDEPGDALIQVSESLYRELLQPFEAEIRDADRLLFVPDGPLNVLPFAALTRRTTKDSRQYVAEWKPSLTINSLTVYSQLRPQRSRAGETSLIAFGSPYLPDAQATGAAVERSGGLRATLGALPWSREEVENIGEVYAAGATVYTGTEATEERAKAETVGNRYVHFATHAVLNERLPLDSSIVLAAPAADAPDRDNGLLQVWEIYESVRLEADLVALSGCETALGTAYAGEGLIGLTRAFQYAGASTVLASLWSVNDHSTSELMTLFYSHLAEGMTMEAALQEAQVALIRGNRSWFGRVRNWFGNDSAPSSHPYHWAGFVLSGPGG